MGLIPDQYLDFLTGANSGLSGGLIAKRHLAASYPVLLLVLSAVVGLIVAFFPERTVHQSLLLGLVTLLALEYLTGRLGVLWNDDVTDTDKGPEETVGETGVQVVGDRMIIAVAVVVGLFGFVLPPTTTRNLISVIVAAVAIHVLFLSMQMRDSKSEIPWSGLIVSVKRLEGRITEIELKNRHPYSETIDLSEADIEDAYGNRHPLRGNVVLHSEETEEFLFGVDSAFRPDPSQPLYLYIDDEKETILWEEPEG